MVGTISLQGTMVCSAPRKQDLWVNQCKKIAKLIGFYNLPEVSLNRRFQFKTRIEIDCQNHCQYRHQKLGEAKTTIESKCNQIYIHFYSEGETRNDNT